MCYTYLLLLGTKPEITLYLLLDLYPTHTFNIPSMNSYIKKCDTSKDLSQFIDVQWKYFEIFLKISVTLWNFREL